MEQWLFCCAETEIERTLRNDTMWKRYRNMEEFMERQKILIVEDGCGYQWSALKLWKAGYQVRQVFSEQRHCFVWNGNYRTVCCWIWMLPGMTAGVGSDPTETEKEMPS